MKVLIAEDDPISRRLLEASLSRSGYDVVSTENGSEAWDALQREAAPRLAVLDWMMPIVDGVELCRRVRAADLGGYVYLILLTAKGQRDDLVAGFEAGADDYLTKPFDLIELRSRLTVGERILALQHSLRAKVEELESAMSHVKQLQGLLPICMHCKKIRDDEHTWHRLESYIEQHSGANFTHSLCSDCLAVHYPQFEKRVAAKQRGER
jgi:DNA-binding response OmpR family regulator